MRGKEIKQEVMFLPEKTEGRERAGETITEMGRLGRIKVCVYSCVPMCVCVCVFRELRKGSIISIVLIFILKISYTAKSKC